MALSVAGILHARDARLLNPYPNCMAVRDKLLVAQRLHAAGIPTPRTSVTGDLRRLRRVVERHPVIVKPVRGFHGHGVHYVAHPDELETIPHSDGLQLVQEFVRGPGEDVKVYVAGEEVFATRKSFTARSYQEPGQPCQVTEAVRSIALRRGELFGLALYGLDIIESPDGPVVVDLNYFPAYKGIPDAPA